MYYTLKIQRAIKFATKTHEVYQKQKRKGKDVAYITHPLTVGIILSLAGAEEDVIIAGILHDTIEDSPSEKKVTPELIRERFGAKVAKLVSAVTEDCKECSWRRRKEQALEHIDSYSDEEILLKSADIIANVREIIDDHIRYGDKIFNKFNSPLPKKKNTLGHYDRMIKAIIRKQPKNPLAKDLKAIARYLKGM